MAALVRFDSLASFATIAGLAFDFLPPAVAPLGCSGDDHTDGGEGDDAIFERCGCFNQVNVAKGKQRPTDPGDDDAPLRPNE
jgi:hypothetical protein